MKFALTIPAAPTMRSGKEAYVPLKRDTELHRIHQTIFGAEQFNGSDKGNARFSPIVSQAGAIVPTIYGAQSFDCAVCEIILRCPDTQPVDPKTGLPTFQIVFPSDFIAHSHSVIRTTMDLNLVDLTNAGQRKIGVTHNALVAGPRSTYPITRRWAEEVHARCPNAQGLYYTSLQLGPQFAVVLFGDRIPTAALTSMTSRRVADNPCHGEIAALAESLSIEYGNV